MVHLFVGPEKKQYDVHKALLCSFSRFFDRAFNGSISEAQKNEMSLPDDSPIFFDVFIAWLYGKQLRYQDCDWTNSEYIEFYVFADHKQCNQLKDAVMNKIQDITGSDDWEKEDIFRSFELTTAATGEKLRDFCGAYMLYQFVYENRWSPSELAEFFVDCPGIAEHYLSIQLRLGHKILDAKCDPSFRDARGWDKPYSGCFFHCHGKEAHCPVAGG